MCIACSPLFNAFTRNMRLSRRRFLRGLSATVLASGIIEPAGSVLRNEAKAQDAGDSIYFGGPILTMNDRQPAAEAVLVRAGRIVAVGGQADLEKQAAADARRIDLAGRPLLPGFFDPHSHVMMIGLQSLSANILPPPDGEGRDIAGIKRLLAEWIAKNGEVIKRYNLIIGFGYDDSQLAEQRHPTRHDLDSISSDVPIILVHQSTHAGVVNSKALQVAGITADTKDPEGGIFHREEGSTQPNGFCEEYAFMQVAGHLVSRLDEAAYLALIRAGAAAGARYGYTTVQEGRALGPATAMFLEAARRNMFDIDVIVFPDIFDTDPAHIAPSRDYKNRCRIGGVKLTIDGAVQGKTAWLTQPYYVRPVGKGPDYAGYPNITKEQATGAFEKAYENDWQIIVHCNGDASIDLMIDCVTAANSKFGKADRRPVLIHGQTCRLDQLEPLKQQGIIPSFFPMHTFYWGDWHRDSTLGPVRAENISPCASALEKGMIFTTHHDAPVANPDSMRVLSATVTRRTRSGDILGPNQRVSVEQALKAMTIWPATQHFEEASKGSIEPGKLADFAILDKNPLTVPVDTLAGIKVVETIKEGISIYKA